MHLMVSEVGCDCDSTNPNPNMIVHVEEDAHNAAAIAILGAGPWDVKLVRSQYTNPTTHYTVITVRSQRRPHVRLHPKKQ